MRILLVDDSILIRKQLRDFFEELFSFNVLESSNCQQAIKYLHDYQPDIVCIDPRIESVKVLDSELNNSSINTIILSSKDTLKRYKRLITGNVLLLSKPINFHDTLSVEDFRQKVEGFLSK